MAIDLADQHPGARRPHVEATDSDIDRLEGLGALNDLLVTEEGEPVDPGSVIRLPVTDGRPVFPNGGSDEG